MMASTFAGNTLAKRSACAFAPAASVCSRRVLVVENAQKKGAGSTKNGRDSQSKRLGVKVWGGQAVKAGGIIMRQRGTVWHAGQNCGLGTDHTVYSELEGVVIFDKKKDRSYIHVFPVEHEKAQAAIQATKTTKPAEGTQSRRERRLAAYKDKPRRNSVVAAAVAAS